MPIHDERNNFTNFDNKSTPLDLTKLSEQIIKEHEEFDRKVKHSKNLKLNKWKLINEKYRQR